MLVIVLTFIVLVALLGKFVLPSKRKKLIASIISDLEEYRLRAPVSEHYGIDENSRFFRAIKHIPTFLYWAVVHSPSITADKLLEIADLELPHWERQLYKDLRWVERKNFPGLLRPLVNTLEACDARIFLDIGCGAMEVERQIILRDARRKTPRPRIFIGVDLSETALEVIHATFKNHEDSVSIHNITSLSAKELSSFLDQKHVKHQILFLNADATKLALSEHISVDVVYSSKFKHHLRNADKHTFDISIKPLAPIVMEFDDYRTAFSWVPLALTGWKRPILLNGALLSRLRQPAKNSLKKQTKTQTIRFFSPPGSYIRYLKP